MKFNIIVRLFARTLAIAFIVVLIFPAASNATDESERTGVTPSVTLAELIEAGIRDNPSIKAKRAAWQGAKQRQTRVRALDDPMLTYTQPIREIETRLGPNKRSVMLSQKIPYPGKLKLKGRIANKEGEIARTNLERATRELVFDIKKSYYEIHFLDMAARLAREKIDVFEHFTKAEMNDYSVGVSGLSDVVSAETRFADAEYDLVLFEELRRAETGRLNALLNRGPDSLIGPLAKPQVEMMEDTGGLFLDELYLLARGSDAIEGAKLKVDKGRLAEELSSLTGRPNFMLGVKYTEIGEPEMAGLADGGRDAVAISLGLTLPIWMGKTRATREEARLARVKSEHEKAALLNGIEAQVKSTYVNMRSNYKLLKLYSDSLIPKAEKLNETARIMYKNGKGSIADIFEVRSMLIDFTLAYHRAATNYMKDRASLERLTAGFVLKEVASDE